MLPAALEVSASVPVDDTGARRQWYNGYCSHLGNELFAVFESTDSESRWNFLGILRQPHTDPVINEVAVAYWRRQKLPAVFVENPSQGAQECGDLAAWQARLHALAIAS